MEKKVFKQMEITIYGLVQGVGFRPFVAEEAEKLNITGTVRNAGGMVKVSASGKKEALDDFVHRLSACAPKGARVDRVEISETEAEGCHKTGSRKREDVSGKKGSLERNGNISSEGIKSSHRKEQGFFIVKSTPEEDKLRFLPPDIATCDFCRKELLDSNNRRYRYPFISCTACGPRFSIMEQMPYDRGTVTMRDFPMCHSCAGEYRRKGDKRRHAQTIACQDCGPSLHLVYPEDFFSRGLKNSYDISKRTGQDLKKEKTLLSSGISGEHAVKQAISLLMAGKVLAVKDIGGYHLAFDPHNSEPAKRLREFKGRENKPFAVMFSDMEEIEKYCQVSETERRLLLSDVRPIVLLRKREGMDFAPEVCGESNNIGAMLPCNPLQILLLEDTGTLVMTSGNRGGEPIITEDEEIFSLCRRGYDASSGEQKYAGIDAVLIHDRRIVFGLDDSIYQVTDCGSREIVQVIRRARGLVPEPVRLPSELPVDTFAAGGDLKAVFALGRKNMAYLSGHFGDLMDVRAAKKRTEAVEKMGLLLGIRPEQAVCDKHPLYISSKNMEQDMAQLAEKSRTETEVDFMKDLSSTDRGWRDIRKVSAGEDRAAVSIKKIQHHHAHILAVMAEHELEGQVLGVAYDGTGYGDDGTVWGGEILLCEGKDFERSGHLESVLLTGGDVTAKNALVTAYCYLYAAWKKGYLSEKEMTGMLPALDAGQRKLLSAALENRIGTIRSSSMGRLFDAATAVLGICNKNSYEGECPEKLQAYAEKYVGKEKDAGRDVLSEARDFLIQDHVGTREIDRQEADKKEEAINTVLRQGDQHGTWTSDGAGLIAALAKAKCDGVSENELAFLFHRSVAEMTIAMCDRIRKEHPALCQIALGGGTMYNRLLLKLLLPVLESKGYQVYVNEKVPSGDGGLAFGQMYAFCLPEHMG